MKSTTLSYLNQIKINYSLTGFILLLCCFSNLSDNLVCLILFTGFLFSISFYMNRTPKETSDEMSNQNLLLAKEKARQIIILLTALIVICILLMDYFHFIPYKIITSTLVFSIFTFYYGAEKMLIGSIFQRLENE